MNRRLLLLFVAALLTLPSCTALQRLLSQVFQKPTLHFERADVRDVSLSGLTLDLTWRIENPNDVGITLDSLGYDFQVEGKQLTKGTTDKGVRIAPKAASKLTLPFEVKFQDVSGTVLDLLQKREVGWAVGGHFGFATPIGPLQIPFRKEGRAPVPRLPSIRLQDAKVTSLSLTGAAMQVSLELHNENPFPIPLDHLAWKVGISGSQVADGTADAPALPAGGRRTLQLPVRVSFTSAGRAIYDALRSGRTQVSVSGRLGAGPVQLPIDVSRQIDLR